MPEILTRRGDEPGPRHPEVERTTDSGPLEAVILSSLGGIGANSGLRAIHERKVLPPNLPGFRRAEILSLQRSGTKGRDTCDVGDGKRIERERPAPAGVTHRVSAGHSHQSAPVAGIRGQQVTEQHMARDHVEPRGVQRQIGSPVLP